MSIMKKTAIAAAMLVASTVGLASDPMVFTNKTSDTTFTPHCTHAGRDLPEVIVLSPNSSTPLTWFEASVLLHIDDGQPVDCAIRDNNGTVFYHAQLTLTKDHSVTLTHDTDATPYKVTISPDGTTTSDHFEAIIDHA